MKFTRIKWAALTLACVFTSVDAAPTLVVRDGILLGAKNVNVLGTLFDVRFADGSCESVFNGCKTASFPFRVDEWEVPLAAAQALLDQVLIDSPLGLFNSDPSKTLGCESTLHCRTSIPYYEGGFINFGNGPVAWYGDAVADNYAAGWPFGPDYANYNNGLSGTDLTTIDAMNFAVFTKADQQITAVPEPGSPILVWIGLAFLVGTNAHACRKQGYRMPASRFLRCQRRVPPVQVNTSRTTPT